MGTPWKGREIERQLVLALALLLLASASASTHNYSTILELPFRFLEIQQSGALPAWNRALVSAGGWRGNAHLADGQDIGSNVSGGWYDAGDHLKVTQPTAYTIATIALGAVMYEKSYRAAGVWDDMVQNVRWGAEWLVKAHVTASDDPEANVLVAQVGDESSDHAYWGRPEQQMQQATDAQLPGYRPTYVINAQTPGADIAGAVSAAMAAASVLLRLPGAHSDVSLADDLEARARQLYQFAAFVQGVWAGPGGGGNPYPSTAFEDDVALASAWLCHIDAAVVFETCQLARAWWSAAFGSIGGPEANGVAGWDNVLPWATMLLLVTSTNSPPAEATLRSTYMAQFVQQWQSAEKQPCGGIGGKALCATSAGYVYSGAMGGSGQAASAGALSVMMATFQEGRTDVNRDRHCFAVRQLGYVLGDNPLNTSFLIGYPPTARQPAFAQHRSSSCDADWSVPCGWDSVYSNASYPNANAALGALVGGLNASIDGAYTDTRTNGWGNEPAVSYVGGLASLAAALLDMQAALPSFCSLTAYCAAKPAKPAAAIPAATKPSEPSEPATAAAAPAAPADAAGAPTAAAIPSVAERPAPAAPAAAAAGAQASAGTMAAAQATASGGWACSNYCADTTYVANVVQMSECTACVTSTPEDMSMCYQCMARAADYLGRQMCFSCIQGDLDNYGAAVREQVERAAKLMEEMLEEIMSELFVEQAAAYIAPGADGSGRGGPPLSEADAVRSTVVQRIEFLDANFLAALNGYIDAAARDPEGPVGELLPLMELLRNEVLYQVALRLPPAARVLNRTLQERDKDARVGVLRTALSGGRGDVPGADGGSLSTAATQFIDDMEEQDVVVDRRLLARLCLVREEVRFLGLEAGFTGGGQAQDAASPSGSSGSGAGGDGGAQGFHRSNVPQRPAAFINQLVAVGVPATRLGLLSRAFCEDWEGAAPRQKPQSSAQKGQPDWVRPGRFMATLAAMISGVEAEAGSGVRQRLADIQMEAISVLDRIQRGELQAV
ncbi:hypothetical protein FOA52_002908 [Chlamydomonas sp. UWO 241]|nr:hypothetical protein FOA52_002908 [Chlamydomonas sp. UWO 241]